MPKNLGSKHKMCRRYGEKLCTTDKCPVMRRNFPPGQHGRTGKSKLTAYGEQLKEKQKAKKIYGLRERQFSNYVAKATSTKGSSPETLLRLLESRLDNVVFRLGLAKTRAAARQLVNHGHFLVNNKFVNKPSYQVRPTDIVSVSSKSQTSPYFKNMTAALEKVNLPSWLVLETTNFSGKVLNPPQAQELQTNFDPKKILEFYSR